MYEAMYASMSISGAPHARPTQSRRLARKRSHQNSQSKDEAVTGQNENQKLAPTYRARIGQLEK